MAKRRVGKTGLPEDVEKAVGAARAEKAGAMARSAVERLDRDNHWTQEPAHTFRSTSWVPSK